MNMSKSLLKLALLFILTLSSSILFSQGDHLLSEGIEYYNAESYEKAIDSFSRAASIEENSSMVWLWLGKAYLGNTPTASFYWKIRKARKMKDFFIKAVELDPDNLEARELLGWYYLNIPSIVGGDKVKAMEQAEEIKKRDYRRGLILFADIYGVMKRDDEAVTIYKELIESGPPDANVLYNFGMYYQKRGNYAAAFQQLENSVLADSSFTNAYYQIGKTGVISGENLERAIECLNIFLEQPHMKNTPKYESAHWRLGMIYELKGDIELAKKEYKASLKIDPKMKKAKNALKKL